MAHLLSHPTFFRNIGDPSKETPPPPIPITKNLSDLIDYLKQNSIDGRQVVPKDKYRRSVADCLASMAMDVLICHEFRHIQAGHLDFVRSRGRGSYIVEEDKVYSPGTINSNMITQAIEMDADCFSFENRLIGYLSQSQKVGKRWGWETVLANRESALFAFIFCTTLLYRLFGDDTTPADVWECDPYPPEPLRVLTAHRIISSCLSEPGYEDLKSKADQIGQAAVGSVETGFRLICEGGIPRKGLEAVGGELGLNHMKQVDGVWNAIRPELANHSYEVPLPEYR
jgi:hypothetical protein